MPGFFSNFDPTYRRGALGGLARALDPTRRKGLWQTAGRFAVKAAPYVAGAFLGPGAAALVGAGSTLLTGDKSIGNILQRAGTGYLSGTAGDLIRGGGGAAAGAATAAPMNPAAALPSPGAAVSTVAGPGAPTRSLLANIGHAVTSAPGAVARYAQKNPLLATGVLSTAADVYGAGQEGAAMDRELALREREFNRRNRVRTPYDQWAAERDRLRGTYSYGAG